MEITGTTVSVAFTKGLILLEEEGIRETSRNGDVIVAPQPVMTTYLSPTHRVLFSPMRDANPYFHFFEFLWMIAGRNDLAFIQNFNSKYTYSDDGVTVPGAYGNRWRVKYNGFDQIKAVVDELKKNPDSRRATLVMADADDLHRTVYVGTKDTPCNTGIYFDLRGEKLNMTVLCRSNDIYWGTFGANVVHFSMLLEYVAAALEKPVGVYHQFSNNFHLYPANVPYYLTTLARNVINTDLYEASNVRPEKMVQSSVEDWDNDLALFMLEPLRLRTFKEPFFSYVAQPMYISWYRRKMKQSSGLEEAKAIMATDWRIACCEWINRREEKKNAGN